MSDNQTTSIRIAVPTCFSLGTETFEVFDCALLTFGEGTALPWEPRGLIEGVLSPVGSPPNPLGVE